MEQIFEIDYKELTGAPFSLDFGPTYAGYTTVGVRHQSGKVIDLIFDAAGDAVEQENEITEKIKQGFTHNGKPPRFAKCLIKNVPHFYQSPQKLPCLAIQLPKP